LLLRLVFCTAVRDSLNILTWRILFVNNIFKIRHK